MNKTSSTTLTTRKLPSGSDFTPESSGLRETFNPTFGLLNSENAITDPIGFDGGTISPVDEDEDITMTMGNELTSSSSVSIFKQMLKSGEWSSPTSFDVGFSDNRIQKYSSDDSFLKKDLRFSTLDRKYDLFYFDFSRIGDSYKKHCIANALSYSRPMSAGFISGLNSECLDQVASFGFKIVSISKNNDIVFVKKNDLNKISHIEIFDKNNHSKKAEMLCDIADSVYDKIAGLQVYKNLRYGSGLLFPYKKAQDVMYHMGTVQFPIDIIFIDSKNKIKKIAKNILPGSLGTYGSSDTLMVLEISGGACNGLGIEVGDIIKSSKPDDSIIRSFNFKYDHLSDRKNYYVKHASFSKKVSFLNFDVFNINDGTKISGLLKSASNLNKMNDVMLASVYNIDEILNSDLGRVKVSTLKSEKEIKISDLINSKELLYIEPTKSAGLSNFMAKNSLTTGDIRHLFFNIKKDLSDGKRVIVTSSIIDRNNILKSLFIKRASEDVIFDELIHSISFVATPIISKEIAREIALDRFGCKLASYHDFNLSKMAGAPIDDSVRDTANKCLNVLDTSQIKLKSIISKFKNNSEQYLKNKDKIELIKGSKDKYDDSCRRISKDIISLLSDIKKVISDMNKIKDISTVEQKIEALAGSCKSFVDIAESIFELSSKIEEDNFVDLLSAETTKVDKSSEDVLNNLVNFSDYISKNILNKKVLSR